MLHRLFDDIPLEQIKEQIQFLSDCDLRATDPDDIREVVRTLMLGYAHTDELHYVYPIRDIFRARVNPSGGLYNRVADLSYPPEGAITRLGRLNNIGQSILYGAQDWYTALVEIQPDADKYVTVMRFRNQNPNTFRYMELGVVENIYNNIRIDSDFDEDGLQKNNIIRSFLIDQFTSIVPWGEEHRYKITVAIAEIILESRAGSVIYPSVARRHEGINLAVKPGRFDENFDPVDCRLYRVESQNSPVRFRTVYVGKSKGITPEGEIVWSDEVRDVIENRTPIHIPPFRISRRHNDEC